MQINIILFGQLTDITGGNSLVFPGITDTDELVEELNRLYPGMAGATYVIAVDGKLVNGNVNLEDNSTVALLPPFSGG